MLQILSINVRKLNHGSMAVGSDVSSFSRSPTQLTPQLLKDLLSAALNAPGFSEKQRWELYQSSEHGRESYRMSPLLQYWPFEVLSRKAHMDENLVEVKLSKDHTLRKTTNQS